MTAAISLFVKMTPAQTLSANLLDSILTWYFDRYNKADTLFYIDAHNCKLQTSPHICFDTIGRPTIVNGKRLVYLDWIDGKKPRNPPLEKTFKVLDFYIRKKKLVKDTLIIPLHLCDATIKENGAYYYNSPDTNTKIDIYLRLNSTTDKYEIIKLVEAL